MAVRLRVYLVSNRVRMCLRNIRAHANKPIMEQSTMTVIKVSTTVTYPAARMITTGLYIISSQTLITVAMTMTIYLGAISNFTMTTEILIQVS